MLPLNPGLISYSYSATARERVVELTAARPRNGDLTSCFAKVVGKYSPSFNRQYVASDLRGQTAEDLAPEAKL
jgi:hypothetical protein